MKTLGYIIFTAFSWSFLPTGLLTIVGFTTSISAQTGVKIIIAAVIGFNLLYYWYYYLITGKTLGFLQYLLGTVLYYIFWLLEANIAGLITKGTTLKADQTNIFGLSLFLAILLAASMVFYGLVFWIKKSYQQYKKDE